MESTCIKAKNYNSGNLSEAFTNNENHEEKFICLIALIRWWNDAVIRYSDALVVSLNLKICCFC